MCVDVNTDTPTSGNAVPLWCCSGVPGQQFYDCNGLWTQVRHVAA